MRDATAQSLMLGLLFSKLLLLQGGPLPASVVARGSVAKNAVNIIEGDMSYAMGGEILQAISWHY
eukprot:3344370-Amphidinium_carterae.1